jgi:hypothetical protein
MAITLKPTQITESKLTPGVSFEIRTVTHGLRMKIDLDVLEANAAVRDFTHQATKSLNGKPGNDPETMKAVATIQLLDKQVRLPILLRAALVAVNGLENGEGQPVSVDEFIELAPSDLIDEAFALCEAACGLSAEERKNSESPSTSRSLAEGETSATTVSSV